MLKSIHQLCGGAMLVGAMLLPQVHAAPVVSTIDFEDPELTNLYFGGDTFTASGFSFLVTGGPTGSSFATVDTAASYSGVKAPKGNATQFFGAFDDNALEITRADGQLFTLLGMDYGFIAGKSYAPLAMPGALRIQGWDGNGNSIAPITVAWSADPLGEFSFHGFDLPAHTTTGLSKLSFVACIYDANDACTYPSDNLGQFALDNLLLATHLDGGSVPEPSTVALLMLGLMGLGLRRRHLKS